MADEIVNRIALSPLITFDLADYYTPGERVVLDIKDRLWQGLALKEKDFREWVKTEDWTQYKGKFVAITCSADAIVPVWAYMLLATVLEPHAEFLVFGSKEELEKALFVRKLNQLDLTQFDNKKIVIKGCGDIDVPTSVYVELTRMLRPLANKIMYGEPCSTVPLYKKPKN